MKLLLALLFTPRLAFAFGTSLEVSVKVSSQICGQPASERISQGLAFNHGGKSYVVTNSSQILNGPGTCHWAGHGAKTSEMKLIAWQWGKLAVLELAKAIPEAARFDLLNSASGFGSMGYIAKFDEAANAWTSIAVSFLNVTSDRGTWKTMIEGQVTLDRSYAGAPVFMGNIFLGLVSDQFLEQKPGSSAELRFWYKTKSNLTTAPLIVIGENLRRFVRQAIAGTATNLDIEISLENQLAGRDTIRTGAYEISEDCPDPSSSTPSGKYPIGGVDPVGVGGGLSKPGCFIRVQLSSQPLAGLNGILRDSQYGEVLEKTFRSAERVEIPYVFMKNTVFDYNDRKVLYSLREFFVHMERAEFKPLTMAYKPGATVSGLDPSLAEIRQLAQKSADGILAFYHKYGKTVSDIENGTVRELYFVASMALTEELREISISQMDALLDKSNHRGLWGLIESEFFNKNKELHPDLTKLRDLLKAL